MAQQVNGEREGAGPLLPNYELCYVCGHANPMGLNVRFRVEPDGAVSTRYHPNNLHGGYPGRLHGGVLAALLDETMGWAPCVAAGRFCVAVELNIRYLKSAPPDRELLVRGRTEDLGKRIWEASGEILDDAGVIYARGRGRYFPLSMEETDAVMALLTVNGERMSLPEALAQARAAAGAE
jgi:uncharacterized protein (TIGR00369 family)